MIDHNSLVLAAGDVQPLPQAVSRLAVLTSEPEPDFDEIVQVITFDPALTISLLRAANSASSASIREISTAQDAVVRLGTGAVMCLAMGSAVRDLADSAIPEFGYLQGEFWRHSMTTALAAQRLKRMSKRPIPTESFTAGLLHDFGKLVMCRCLEPESFSFLTRAHDEGGLSSAEAEIELFGITHADIGGEIARHWRLPDELIQAIVFHHTPSQMPGLINYAVHLADAAAKHLDGDEDAIQDIDPKTWEALGFNPEQLDDLCEKVQLERSDAVALLQ